MGAVSHSERASRRHLPRLAASTMVLALVTAGLTLPMNAASHAAQSTAQPRVEIRGLEVRTVQPYYRLAKQRAFRSAASPVPVTDGSFTWQRATSKKMTVYVEAGDLRSNTVSVPAR